MDLIVCEMLLDSLNQAKIAYKKGLTGVPNQAYATAIGLFNSIINVILLIIANTTSKKFSENSLW
jgi:putative aldouronate transport system permease protein